MWWAGNCSITESLSELIQDVTHFAEPWEAGLNGKQFGKDSLTIVPTPHSYPFTTLVTERRSKVLTP